MPDESIYGEIGDYVPSLYKNKSISKDKKKGNYFEKPEEEQNKTTWDSVRPNLEVKIVSEVRIWKTELLRGQRSEGY